MQTPKDPTKLVEDELDDEWIDATDTVNLRGRIYKTLKCECGNIQLTYRYRVWCECLDCKSILIDRENRELEINNPTEPIELNKEKSGLEKIVEKAKKEK